MNLVTASDQEGVLSLQAENARLIALLEAHSIEWQVAPAQAVAVNVLEPSKLSTEEKLALFRRLFRGRLV